MESTLGTIRHRTDRAKGCVTRDIMLDFVYKLAMCAERRWLRIRGDRQLGKVIQGVKFEDGIAIEETSAGRAA
jgi:putative transposase